MPEKHYEPACVEGMPVRSRHTFYVRLQLCSYAATAWAGHLTSHAATQCRPCSEVLGKQPVGTDPPVLRKRTALYNLCTRKGPAGAAQHHKSSRYLHGTRMSPHVPTYMASGLLQGVHVSLSAPHGMAVALELLCAIQTLNRLQSSHLR